MLGIFDLSKFKSRNADISFVMFLVRAWQLLAMVVLLLCLSCRCSQIEAFIFYYPKRLTQVLFVDAPWVFQPVWTVIKPMLRKYGALVRAVGKTNGSSASGLAVLRNCLHCASCFAIHSNPVFEPCNLSAWNQLQRACSELLRIAKGHRVTAGVTAFSWPMPPWELQCQNRASVPREIGSAQSDNMFDTLRPSKNASEGTRGQHCKIISSEISGNRLGGFETVRSSALEIFLRYRGNHFPGLMGIQMRNLRFSAVKTAVAGVVAIHRSMVLTMVLLQVRFASSADVRDEYFTQETCPPEFK